MRLLPSILADVILVLHALIVLFNVGMLPLIWVGSFRKWQFVRKFWLRLTHLALIAFVTVQALLGEICPLTNWENALRVAVGGESRYAESFVTHWMQRLLFYEADDRVFAAAYAAFLVLTALTLVAVKPLPPAWRRRRD
jgi:hypothetical protein